MIVLSSPSSSDTSTDNFLSPIQETPTVIMADLRRRSSAVASIRRMASEVLAEGYEADAFALQQHRESLEQHFMRFSTAHDALIVAAEDSEIDAHEALWLEIEPLYNQAMAHLRRLHESDGSESVRSRRCEGKLEPLAVAKFDGSLHNWLAFRDSFETLVHTADFSEAYKLGRLRDAVAGEAGSLVGGTYSGGYKEVWAALVERYDRPRHLAGIHITSFLGISPA